MSRIPSAWLMTSVTEGTSRNPGVPPREDTDIDIRKGDSFIVAWHDGDWSLLERSPGDLDRFGRLLEMEVAADHQFKQQGALYTLPLTRGLPRPALPCRRL